MDAAANDDNGSQGPHKTGDGEVEKSSPGTGLNADCYNSENVALTNMQGLLVGTDIDRRKTTLAADADLNTIDAKGVTTTALQSHDPEYNADSDTVSAVVPSSSDPGTEGPGAAKPGKSAELVEEAVPGPIASNTNLIPHQLKQSAHSKLEAQYQADRLRIIKEANSAAPDERIEISDDTDDISDSEEGDRQDNHEDGTEEDQNRNNTPKIAEKKPTLSLQSPKKSRQTPPIPKSIAHKTLISFLLPDFKDWLFDFHELFNVEIETFIAWCRATPGAYDDALNGTEGLQMLTFSVMQQLLAQDSTFYAIIMSQHARMHNVAWKVISNLLYPTRVPQDLSKQTADGTLDIPPHDRGPVYRATYNHRIKSSGDVWTFPIEYLIQTDLDNNPILPSDTRNELTLSHMMRRMPECQLHTDRTFNKAGDRPIYDPLIRFSPCTAVGEALIGMRGWDDLLVSGELSRIWNQRGTDLVYMRRIMSKTLEGYKACTQFQVPHHRIELSRDMSSSEAEPSPRSSVRLPSESLSVQKAVRASSSKTTIKSPTSPVRDSGDAMDRIAARDPVRQVDDLSTVETNEEGSKTTLDLVTKKMRAGKVPVSASQVPQGRRKGYDDPPLAPGLSRGWRKPPF